VVAQAPAEQSIAVLPFANMSADPENEYFSDGMTEEIINALTQIPSLHVAARTSSFAFKGQNLDVADIARRLKVSKVLEGSVRKAGNKLRITAQLINAADGYHLWSEKFDRDIEDIFAIQDEIAGAIADQLEVRLTGETTKALVKHGTDNIDAYNAYLKGRHFVQQRGPGVEKAIACFEEAIQKDENFAQPYAGFAEIFGAMGAYGYIPSSVAFSKARAAAERAVAMDKELAEGYAALGATELWFGWDWTNAERQLLRALELNPRLALAHAWLAVARVVLDRGEEAVRSITRAVELEPVSPLIHSEAGLIHFLLGQYRDAIESAQPALELDPTSNVALWVQGLAWSHLGEHTKAVALVDRAVSLAGNSPVVLSALAMAYGRAGQADDALRIAHQLVERSRTTYIPPASIAVAYFALGDLDSAFEWLRAGLAERNTMCGHIAFWPDFDPLRADPRWREMAPPELVELRPPTSSNA
jgi:TolB-like protein/Flp pilus assembly protein TadD